MPTSSATSFSLIRRSFVTIFSTFFTFSSIIDLLGRPERLHFQHLRGDLENANTSRKHLFLSLTFCNVS
jgi:hypothetical protein